MVFSSANTEKPFKYKFHCLRHLSKHQTKTHKYKCSICGKTYKRLDSLNRHKIKHKNITYKCKICNKKYSDRASAVYHMREKHNRKDPVAPCTVCGKAFASEKNLKYHLNSHAKLMKFKCEQCPAEFCNPWGKSRHKKEKVIN